MIARLTQKRAVRSIGSGVREQGLKHVTLRTGGFILGNQIQLAWHVSNCEYHFLPQKSRLEAGKQLHCMNATRAYGVEVARREKQFSNVSRKITSRNGVGKTQAIGLGGSHHPDPMCYSSDISAHRLGGNLTLRLGWHASESI
jgi:hypothetical protein